MFRLVTGSSGPPVLLIVTFAVGLWLCSEGLEFVRGTGLLVSLSGALVAGPGLLKIEPGMP